ncbi:cobalamin biosynthesis protein CobG [Streptomyces beihaiensis]|uniref:Nitrite/sulfite reductase n=1 Tax=Streptomyces beihaiensis TaxID=2984495 RepID=A0ABT3U209_9ACTN|nr:cobalamin biosynthesis protein CobG [Streptomyces beihaiensis]MCX3062305.1 nitrite/sulfite reductase [Streptomyces beihaiensis]
MPDAPIPSAPSGPGSSGSSSGDACPGALRLHAADDGGLARIRVPGGVLTVPQARALGDAAVRHGDGVVRITSRGNVEVRGLDLTGGAAFGNALTAAGLLPSPTHERVRNILASPLAGLDGAGSADVREWLRELDRLLLAHPDAPALSAKYLFGLDDGRGDIAALGPDVLLRALGHDHAVLRLGAEPYELPVAYGDGPRAAVAATEEFLAAADADPGRAWRVGELDLGTGELTRRVACRLGVEPVPAKDAAPSATAPPEPPPPGPVTDATGTVRAWSVLAPFGAVSADAWTALVAAADGEVRLTPWRGVVVPGADREPLERAGLVTDPASPWAKVSACVGRPGCAKSLADVRAHATAAVRSGEVPHDGPPWHWSGCERRCGRPTGPHTDVVARADGTYHLTAPTTA